MTEILKVKRLDKEAILPKRATDGSAGFDICANIKESITIKPNEVVKIPTGIAIELSSNKYVGLVYSRSGLSSKNLISLVNSVGVIDSDYRGEILIPFINHSDKEYVFNKNDRIAQIIITPVILPQIVEEDELSDTQRGCDGFGSTTK